MKHLDLYYYVSCIRAYKLKDDIEGQTKIHLNESVKLQFHHTLCTVLPIALIPPNLALLFFAFEAELVYILRCQRMSPLQHDWYFQMVLLNTFRSALLLPLGIVPWLKR